MKKQTDRQHANTLSSPTAARRVLTADPGGAALERRGDLLAASHPRASPFPLFLADACRKALDLLCSLMLVVVGRLSTYSARRAAAERAHGHLVAVPLWWRCVVCSSWMCDDPACTSC
ncbi:hypothetical protein BRADI_3g09955v3 [Brachypodium distachyon]|uniref:Uncharacterized protein n=1 Tax=Brachypodium distachyon TaxID=15368 RepID=A0A0Q3F434_BRADI|nr:hypothetical protein BRADI_3g09955v3 [Brachypodium distachyon]